MFVFGAAVLWGFVLGQKTCPVTGEKVPIDTQATNSHVILEPDEYQIDIKPRNKERAGHILEGYREVVGKVRL
jgi:hypothetical protein